MDSMSRTRRKPTTDITFSGVLPMLARHQAFTLDNAGSIPVTPIAKGLVQKLL